MQIKDVRGKWGILSNITELCLIPTKKCLYKMISEFFYSLISASGSSKMFFYTTLTHAWICLRLNLGGPDCGWGGQRSKVPDVHETSV